ncbi:MAG: cobalamin biosynthesis protein CbiD, partial [Schwartzia sp.]|nr:cobalamin biosynthesis protein CbiD [Schwartzia sp. (in: firmicutes)]
EYKYMHVCNTLAERASARAERFIFNKLTVGTVLATMQGTILGMDEHAKEMGRDFHWDIE